jgi:hypothetical protein
MKKNKLILLIVLVILIALYFALRQKDSVERNQSLVSLDPQLIDRISIWDQEARIDLYKSEGIWKLSDPVPWPADTLRIAMLWQKVIEGKYNDVPMSDGKAALSRYNLEDENALHISLQAGSRKEHLLFSNIGNAWDYFRRAGDNTVYQAQNHFAQDLAPILINWRNPEIIKYWEHEIKQIRVEHEKNKYSLIRDGVKWTFKDAKHDFEVVNHNFALSKIVSILQNLNSHVFISGDDPKFKAVFDKPVATVWITDTKDKTRKLTFAKFIDQRYVLMLDDDPSVLYQVEFDTVFRFTRNPEIFMRKSII